MMNNIFKVLLVIFISFLSSPSWSETKWIKIDLPNGQLINSEKGFGIAGDVYLDKKSLENPDNVVFWSSATKKMHLWIMFDYAKQTIFEELSQVIYREVDCVKFGYKNMQSYSYDASMGTGKTLPISYSSVLLPSYPPPNSVNLAILEAACSHVMDKFFPDD